MRSMVTSLREYHTEMIDLPSSLRIALLITVPMTIGIYIGRPYMGLIGALGVFTFSMVEIPRFPKKPQMKHLLVSGAANSVAFTLGTLVGLTGVFSVPLFGLGFFIAAYLTSNNETVATGLVACVLFSLGIGLPGGNTLGMAFSRLWISFAGELLGMLGVVVHWAVSKWIWPKVRKFVAEVEPDDGQIETTVNYRKILAEASSRNPVLKNEHMLYSIVFGVSGAAALAISHRVDLSREYWVLLTLAILLLRSDISTALNFTVLRIIGTVIGAIAGLAVIGVIVTPLLLVPFFFAFAGLFFALRALNFGLGTVFITAFILILIDIPHPGQAVLAQDRIVDTFIAAGIAIAAIFVLWIGGKFGRGRGRSKGVS